MPDQFYNIYLEDDAFVCQASPEHCKMITNKWSVKGVQLACMSFEGDFTISPEAMQHINDNSELFGFEVKE